MRFPIVLLTLITVGLVTGCSFSKKPEVTFSASANSATPIAVSPTPQSDTFQDALETAKEATVTAQSAKVGSDWNLVNNKWQKAIELLETVPESSPNYTLAQTKIREYQHNLIDAQQQISPALQGHPDERAVAGTRSR